jgi:hypothetical protein
MVFEGRDILAVNTAYSGICRVDIGLWLDPPPPEAEADAPRANGSTPSR